MFIEYGTKGERLVDISIVEGDALAIHADVLVLKYAQALYGVDELVVEKLDAAGEGIRERLPKPGGFRIIDAHGHLGAKRVLFVGVVTLRAFGYEAIREFARRALVSLAGALPAASHVAFTLHGAGYGLDETEAFRSELAGLLDAIESGDGPQGLRQLTIVERNAGRGCAATFSGGPPPKVSSPARPTSPATPQTCWRSCGADRSSAEGRNEMAPPLCGAAAMRHNAFKTSGRCFRAVDFMSDGHPKLIPIDKETNHQVVHVFRLGKADSTAYQSLDPRAQVDVLALDLLGVFLPSYVFLCLYMPLHAVRRHPAVREILRDAKGLQQCLQFEARTAPIALLACRRETMLDNFDPLAIGAVQHMDDHCFPHSH